MIRDQEYGKGREVVENEWVEERRGIERAEKGREREKKKE